MLHGRMTNFVVVISFIAQHPSRVKVEFILVILTNASIDQTQSIHKLDASRVHNIASSTAIIQVFLWDVL